MVERGRRRRFRDDDDDGEGDGDENDDVDDDEDKNVNIVGDMVKRRLDLVVVGVAHMIESRVTALTPSYTKN